MALSDPDHHHHQVPSSWRRLGVMTLHWSRAWASLLDEGWVSWLSIGPDLEPVFLKKVGCRDSPLVPIFSQSSWRRLGVMTLHWSRSWARLLEEGWVSWLSIGPDLEPVFLKKVGCHGSPLVPILSQSSWRRLGVMTLHWSRSWASLLEEGWVSWLSIGPDLEPVFLKKVGYHDSILVPILSQSSWRRLGVMTLHWSRSWASLLEEGWVSWLSIGPDLEPVFLKNVGCHESPLVPILSLSSWRRLGVMTLHWSRSWASLLEEGWVSWLSIGPYLEPVVLKKVGCHESPLVPILSQSSWRWLGVMTLHWSRSWARFLEEGWVSWLSIGPDLEPVFLKKVGCHDSPLVPILSQSAWRRLGVMTLHWSRSWASLLEEGWVSWLSIGPDLEPVFLKKVGCHDSLLVPILSQISWRRLGVMTLHWSRSWASLLEEGWASWLSIGPDLEPVFLKKVGCHDSPLVPILSQSSWRRLGVMTLHWSRSWASLLEEGWVSWLSIGPDLEPVLLKNVGCHDSPSVPILSQSSWRRLGVMTLHWSRYWASLLEEGWVSWLSIGPDLEPVFLKKVGCHDSILVPILSQSSWRRLGVMTLHWSRSWASLLEEGWVSWLSIGPDLEPVFLKKVGCHESPLVPILSLFSWRRLGVMTLHWSRSWASLLEEGWVSWLSIGPYLEPVVLKKVGCHESPLVPILSQSAWRRLGVMTLRWSRSWASLLEEGWASWLSIGPDLEPVFLKKVGCHDSPSWASLLEEGWVSWLSIGPDLEPVFLKKVGCNESTLVPILSQSSWRRLGVMTLHWSRSWASLLEEGWVSWLSIGPDLEPVLLKKVGCHDSPLVPILSQSSWRRLGVMTLHWSPYWASLLEEGWVSWLSIGPVLEPVFLNKVGCHDSPLVPILSQSSRRRLGVMTLHWSRSWASLTRSSYLIPVYSVMFVIHSVLGLPLLNFTSSGPSHIRLWLLLRLIMWPK